MIVGIDSEIIVESTLQSKTYSTYNVIGVPCQHNIHPQLVGSVLEVKL